MPQEDEITPEEEARHWLHFMYDGVEDTEWLTIFAIDRHGGGPNHTEWFRLSEIDKAAKLAIKLARTHCVWFGVATRRERLLGKRGGAEDCITITGVWLDLDLAGAVHAQDNLPPDMATAEAIIAKFPVRPTATVSSGHGLQAWWMFEEPVPASDMAPLLARWNATWTRLAAPYHVDNVFDVPRIMRLPGTTNNKAEPRPVRTIQFEDTRYGFTDLLELLDDEPEPEPARDAPRWEGTEGLPGQVFNERHNGAEILRRLGFELDHTDRQTGDEHYRRPGKTKGQGASATWYPNDGHTTIWSDTVRTTWPALDLRRPYDPFGLYAATHHGGDFTAAAAELERQGYGTLPNADIPDLDDIFDASGRSTQHPAGPVLPVLPSDFWTQRDTFTHIRDAADAWLCSPDAVLAAVLTRIAAFSHHGLCIPARLGPATPLCLITAMAGPSGAGKSKAASLASELAPSPDDIPDSLPLGSGEGLVEALFETEKDDDGKPAKVQKRHNAFFYADEGKVLSELAGRNGSTLTSMLRTAWTGATLGQANAGKDTHRVLPAGTYVYGVLLGIQPRAGVELFSDTEVAAGTTQRFLWACALHPEVGDRPGDLDAVAPVWRPRTMSLTGITDTYPIDTPESVFAECRAALIAKARGEAGDELDSHRNLMRLKVMGLLALLEGRQAADLDDWRIAGQVIDNSEAVRTWMRRDIAAARSERLRAAGMADAHRDAAREDATYERALRSAVKTVTNFCARHPDEIHSAASLYRLIAGRHRKVVESDDVMREAVAKGRIEGVKTEDGTMFRIVREGSQND